MVVGLMGWEDPERGWGKGPWTPEEDKLLTEYVSLHGEGRWSTVARSAGLNRGGKSCRLRWVNYLRPGLKRGQITPQEEGIIIELHALWGNKWSTIARYLPGRTDNEIKNYWRTHFKKKPKSSSKKQENRSKADHHHQFLHQNHHQFSNDTKNSPDYQTEMSNENKSESESKGKQEMVFMYPTLEDQYIPEIDQNVSSALSETSMVEDGLWGWGGLWNLEDWIATK